MDTPCGHAALTLMPPDKRVLTVELKINLLAPAARPHLIARGEVLRSRRTLTVCRGDAYTLADGSPKHVATVLTTMASVPGTT